METNYAHPDAVMKFVLKLMHLVGLEGPQKSQRIRFGWLFVLFLVFSVFPYLFGGHEDLDRFVEGSIEFLFNCNMFGAGILFAWKAIHFQAYVMELKKLSAFTISYSTRLTHKLAQYNRRADIFAKSCTTFMASVGLFYWIAPLPGIYWAYFTRTNDSEPLRLVQHLEVKFYWLDNRNSLRDYTIFAGIMLPVVFLCTMVENIKVLAISYSVEYCTMFMSLVTLAVKQLDDISADDRLARELQKVLLMHKHVLECARLLNTVLSPLLLLQWVLCILNWSVTLLFLNHSGIRMKSTAIIVMFLLATLEMLAYCILGTRLTTQAEQLERSIYASRWYKLPVRMQQNVQIFLHRAQKCTGICGGKFVRVNLEEFSRMVNRSYSAYVVLKDQIKLNVD